MPDLSPLIDLASILNRQTDFDEILRLVSHRSADILQADAALIMMINPATQQTTKTVIRQGSEVKSRRFHAVQEQITGWMLESNRPLICADIGTDPRFTISNKEELPFRSAIASLLITENAVLGSIIVLNSEHSLEFTADDLSMLEKVTIIVAPYLRNIEKIKEFFSPNISENALLKKYADVGLIGTSRKFVELLQAIEAAARCDVRVVLEGESGTGKELIARAIHRFSNRNGNAFVTVDCGAIPEHLIESELFGHKKGAFTGALQDRKGLIEEATLGTLFIDEIASLPLEMQSKFMRFLQEGEVRPLGSNTQRKVDVRIVSASSQSLRKLVEAGKFREDLFFRLHVYPIYAPSLRERKKDIVLLANHFLAKFSKRQNKKVYAFCPDILNYFRQRAWQGNIRELENFVERLITVAPVQAEAFLLKMLPDDLRKDFEKVIQAKEYSLDDRPLAESVAEFEEKLIRQALAENTWNQSQAARMLNISEHTLRYKMKKLKIVKP
ncbi:MAG: sigma 54-interacting transcriptional regulator [bacterium]